MKKRTSFVCSLVIGKMQQQQQGIRSKKRKLSFNRQFTKDIHHLGGLEAEEEEEKL